MNKNYSWLTRTMKFEVTNRVYCSSVDGGIDLKDDNLTRIPGFHRPHIRFPGCSLKLSKGTLIMFKSGKLILNGLKTADDFKACVAETEAILGRKLHNQRLVNICGSAKFDRIVNLEKLYTISKGILDADLHPGLFLKNKRVNIIVYHTSCIFTGCKSLDEFNSNAVYIESLINKYDVAYPPLKNRT